MLLHFESVFKQLELERNKHLQLKQPFSKDCTLEADRKVPSQSSQGSYEIREGCCDVCYELFSDCHRKQFSTFCFLSTKRQTKTFPEAMVSDAVQLYYIKKYNSALRFVLYEKTGVVHEDEFKLPPECL